MQTRRQRFPTFFGKLRRFQRKLKKLRLWPQAWINVASPGATSLHQHAKFSPLLKVKTGLSWVMSTACKLQWECHFKKYQTNEWSFVGWNLKLVYSFFENIQKSCTWQADKNDKSLWCIEPVANNFPSRLKIKILLQKLMTQWSWEKSN